MRAMRLLSNIHVVLFIHLLCSLMSTAHAELTQCISGINVKEYHPFYLESVQLGSPISKRFQLTKVVGGDRYNRYLRHLQFCAASTDFKCDNHIPSDCIHDDVGYRFRVHGPGKEKGYLKIEGDELDIVENFDDGSVLNVYSEEGSGLMIVHTESDGSQRVFTTNGGGQPITLEKPVHDDARQWFDIIGLSGRYSL